MTDETLVFGHYLVAFVDLLGQRDKLKKFDAIPKDRSGIEYLEFVEIVKDTVGAVDDLQQTCRQLFDQFGDAEQNRILQQFPGLHKFNKIGIKFQHFSDGLVIYMPLKEDGGYSPAKGVYAALAACGMLCLIGLAKKRPIRIGIAIGIAAELRDNELYGKAVADAYEAESFIAQYPRVLVANDVLNYLKERANLQCEEKDIDCHMKSGLAQQSLKLLSPDYDGRLIVDYLGDFFRKHLLAGEHDSLCQIAYQYVNDELVKQQERQNTKLAFRYSLLHGYFFDHLGELKPVEK
jgi:hypothetical protein